MHVTCKRSWRVQEADETEFVPIGTDELPAVKRAPGGLLVRFAKDVEGATASYVCSW